MTVLSVTANNISASEERGAVLIRFVTGEAMSPGQAVYLDSNNLCWKAKADSAAHARAIGIVVSGPGIFYGETTIPVGGTATICIGGPVFGFSGLSQGLPIYVDKTTAGSLNDAAPTTAYQFVVGQAEGNDTIFVRPGVGSPVSA